jgi:hypothetical protein
MSSLGDAARCELHALGGQAYLNSACDLAACLLDRTYSDTTSNAFAACMWQAVSALPREHAWISHLGMQVTCRDIVM